MHTIVCNLNITMNILTKNKAELLRIFFTNPEQSFYMQEIGRAIGKKPGVFQRTLNTLVNEGILKNERRANARYFWINKECPLYEELKSIVFKTIGIQGSITSALSHLQEIRFAFIYGSYAKNKEHKDSDIDVMVIGSVDEDALIAQLDQLENQLKREINYHLYTFNAFKLGIKNKDAFLLGILKEKKVMLSGEENELRRIYKE